MRIEVIPIDFLGQGALLEPKDAALHDLAVDYCRRELQNGDKLNLTQFNKVWVACVMEDSKPVEVVGITGWVHRIDLPVFRVSGQNAVRATKMLADRLHAFFQDQGCRGQELFIHISSKETPEQRCEKWQESLAAEGAIPADRLAIVI
jgi:hypothetical protein